MDRRTFFKRTAVLVGACALKALPAAAQVRNGIELQCSPVAGFQYGEGETVWDMLSVGAPLALVREPDNLYDERAVRVEWNGRKLGYIPRRENISVCHLLDSGRVLEARIVRLADSEDPWERVLFSVGLVV